MSARSRPARAVGIAIGALVILAIGLYGPATLLGPLPAASVEIKTPGQAAPSTVAPALPDGGASAVTLGVDDAPLAMAGSSDILPMAGIAKLVTALVVLDAKPLAAGRQGPAITISIEDYRSYIDNTNDGNTTVTVLPGETWTQREMLQAMVLGSSNNHAESLARWAYGSRAAFLDAASAWLIEYGLTSTRVADETGLSAESAGSAADLARLAALVMANPVLAEMLTDETPGAARAISNRMAYLPDRGVVGISRSYTDDAGVCLLFALNTAVGGQSLPLYGVFLGLPDWESMDTAANALVDSAEQGVARIDLASEGDVFATFTTVWGDTAHAVTVQGASELAWQREPAAQPRVSTTSFSTSKRGAPVGTVVIDSREGPVMLPLTLDRAITDPGPGWRLLHPIPVIQSLIESLQSPKPAPSETN